MISPFVVSVGTPAAANSGAITPGLPPGYTLNDILLLFVDTAQDTVHAPTGYAQVGPDNGFSPNTFSNDVTGATRLTVFWKRASAAEAAPSVSNTFGMIYGVIMAVRGCRTYGDPFFVVSQYVKPTETTAYSSVNQAESIDDSLIVYGISNSIDSTGAHFTLGTNANLTNLTKQFDNGTTDGVGGGLVIVTGDLATAGMIGILTGTWSSITSDVTDAFAMIPATAIDIVASPRASEIQVFYANSTNTPNTSTWTKPYGAQWVRIIGIGGGGGGGNGRTTATAHAGGAGGGGGYTDKTVLASGLGPILTVNPGDGGSGGANAAAGGNAGNNGGSSTVVDPNNIENGAPWNILTASGAGGGTGATTGANGAAGSGGGRGTSAAAGAQGLGGQGGGGGGAAQAGGPGDEGGGGGSGGSASSNLFGGLSLYGGGGGGGGAVGSTGGSGGGSGGGATGGGAGQAGFASPYLTLGGGGGGGGNSLSPTGGVGGFPGGGGGGGPAGATNTAGGAGANGIVVIITSF
jgi:hypothetical protein